MVISENDVRTILAVFEELLYKKPYSEVNTYIGSMTFEDMRDLYLRAKQNYEFHNGKEFDEY